MPMPMPTPRSSLFESLQRQMIQEYNRVRLDNDMLHARLDAITKSGIAGAHKLISYEERPRLVPVSKPPDPAEDIGEARETYTPISFTPFSSPGLPRREGQPSSAEQPDVAPRQEPLCAGPWSPQDKRSDSVDYSLPKRETSGMSQGLRYEREVSNESLRESKKAGRTGSSGSKSAAKSPWGSKGKSPTNGSNRSATKERQERRPPTLTMPAGIPQSAAAAYIQAQEANCRDLVDPCCRTGSPTSDRHAPIMLPPPRGRGMEMFEESNGWSQGHTTASSSYAGRDEAKKVAAIRGAVTWAAQAAAEVSAVHTDVSLGMREEIIDQIRREEMTDQIRLEDAVDLQVTKELQISKVAEVKEIFSPKAPHNSEGGRDSTCSGKSLNSQTSMRVGGMISINVATRERSSLAKAIFTFLDDPESSKWAYGYVTLFPFMITMACCITMLQTLDEPPIDGFTAAVFETFFDCVFLIDILARFLTCPDRCSFFYSSFNLIDLTVAVLPLSLRASLGFIIDVRNTFDIDSLREYVLICGPVTVLRLLKTLRHLEKLTLMISAFKLAFEALPVLLFMQGILALVFASLIYLVEPRDNIDTLPRALWLTLVTMTTVGYGDYYPTTGAGYCVVSCLIACSMLYMAILPGILGNAFVQIWDDRDRLLLIRAVRWKLIQSGFKAIDIPEIFKAFDRKATGELDLKGFRNMIMEMHIGLNEERIVKLFVSFDEDGSGAIDDKEFVRALFPGDYALIYGQDEDDDDEDLDLMATPPRLESPE